MALTEMGREKAINGQMAYDLCALHSPVLQCG